MYSPPNSTASRRSIATRQRVSRACDRCNHLRVKCDGQRPCEHCLVYGLECKYDRQQKKRGKGSLRNSKGNSSTSTGEPLTPTTTNSPSSSPTTFHLSIPASHLYCVDIPEDKDGYQTDFVSVPSSQQSSQHCTPEPQYSPLFKAEPETSGVNSFPAVYTDERSRGAGGGGTLMAQQQLRHFFQIPESIMYTSQVWSRPGGPEAFDGPKCSPSSNEPLTPPEGYQLLPYMPLCASCHCNPSVRLYPGSVLWLPAATSQPHDAPGYGALVCEGGTYCFGDQQKAMVRGP